MRKGVLLILGLILYVAAMAQTIIRPSVKTPTSFAIIIDRQSYNKAKTAVEAYRNSIEADHLGTYIAIDDWQKPEDIRQLLQKWHADKQQPLEGAVFVGDIPIPMIRDAQYLTSAFKMNQGNDWKVSSVPSDRFYDDFGLRFSFLKQDKEKPLYFYYSLTADSKPYLSPDIYSGRIKPLELKGHDKYKMLADYLNKVARLKRQEAHNVLDNLTMARGHSYNSEDPLAWAGEQIALREQMPQLFRRGYTVKFYDFNMMYPVKNLYLNEVMNPDLDVLLFHHHGATDTQYLNGYPEVSGVEASIANIKRYLHGKVLDRSKKTGCDSAVTYYAQRLDVPEHWCSEAFDPAVQKADSLADAAQDIYTVDLRRLKTNARFVLFDACFNGSFHVDDNVAGAYIFNDGMTLATIGGTVNALQDKWPDEFIGLLSAGMRVGQFNRFGGYLESHVIGDPTLRFQDNSNLGFDINQGLTRHYCDAKFWRKILRSPVPDAQAMALRQLHLAGEKDMPALLKHTYETSDNFVVRMEAVKLLSLYYPDASVEVLKESLNDSYELVRRLSAIYADRNGSPQLIPAIVATFLKRGHEPRLSFQLLNNIEAFDSPTMLHELDQQQSRYTLYSDAIVNKLRTALRQEPLRYKEIMDEINDFGSKPTRRKNTILRFRNMPRAKMIETILQSAANEKEDMDVRIAAIHTLGWYDTHYQRDMIARRLRQIESDNPALKAEIERSVNRLTCHAR